MIVVEINFGVNQSEDIIVNQGDDPDSLAEEFVAQHGLNPKFISIISDHIRRQIDSKPDRPASPLGRTIITPPVSNLNEVHDWTDIFNSLREMSPTTSFKGSAFDSKDDKQSDVGYRLYEESFARRKRNDQRRAMHAAVRPPEDWSCARCCTFQIRKFDELSKTDLICINCGWNQEKLDTHSPARIAKTYNKGYRATRSHTFSPHSLSTTSSTLRSRSRLSNSTTQETHLTGLSECTFRPTLSRMTQQLIHAATKNISKQSSPPLPLVLRESEQLLEISTYMNMPLIERLSKFQRNQVVSASTLQKKAREQAEPRKSSRRLSCTEARDVADRLEHYEQERKMRLRVAEARIYRKDPETNQPYFQPVLSDYARKRPLSGRRPRSAEPRLGASLDSKANSSGIQDTLASFDIVQELYFKEEQRQLRLEALKKTTLDKQAMEHRQATALPQSHALLQESTESDIEELYRLLLVTTQGSISVTDIEDLSQRSRVKSMSDLTDKVEDWQNRLLDLRQLKTDLMVEEVKTLLQQVTKILDSSYSKINSHTTTFTSQEFCHAVSDALAMSTQRTILSENLSTEEEFFDPRSPRADIAIADSSERPETSTDSDYMIIGFTKFRSLIYQCLRERETGKSYLFALRKRPEIAWRMALSERAEETFQPCINNRSVRLGRIRSTQRRIELSSPKDQYNRYRIGLPSPNGENTCRESVISDLSDTQNDETSNLKKVELSESLGNILHKEAKILQARQEDLRQRFREEEIAKYTFKPFIHPMPKRAQSVPPQLRRSAQSPTLRSKRTDACSYFALAPSVSSSYEEPPHSKRRNQVPNSTVRGSSTSPICAASPNTQNIRLISEDIFRNGERTLDSKNRRSCSETNLIGVPSLDRSVEFPSTDNRKETSYIPFHRMLQRNASRSRSNSIRGTGSTKTGVTSTEETPRQPITVETARSIQLKSAYNVKSTQFGKKYSPSDLPKFPSDTTLRNGRQRPTSSNASSVTYTGQRTVRTDDSTDANAAIIEAVEREADMLRHFLEQSKAPKIFDYTPSLLQSDTFCQIESAADKVDHRVLVEPASESRSVLTLEDYEQEMRCTRNLSS